MKTTKLLLAMFFSIVVASCGGGGGSSQPAAPVLTAPMGVISVSGTGQVTVTWSVVSDATSYNIYWGTSPDITVASNKITGATSPYVATGLSSGSTYYYRVSSVNATGEALSGEQFSYVYPGGNPAGIFTASNGTMADAGLLTASGKTATLLSNGKVLITGHGSAELYDAGVDSFTATAGNVVTSRSEHTSIQLANGKVLVFGGGGFMNNDGYLTSAELFDPVTESFSATGSMTISRTFGTATLLPNGKVLVTGGIHHANMNLSSTFLSSAELYDPATGKFSPTGTMLTARAAHTATLLANGKVLIVGGYNTNNHISSAELYDPVTGKFSATNSSMSGVPTRLLDWSRNPLVAAYFAVNEEAETDSAIYVLKSTKNSVSSEEENKKSPFEYNEQRKFIPAHITERIIAQSGLFTIHPEPEQHLSGSEIKKIIIKNSFRKKLKDILFNYGIHRASLFPDLDGLTEHITWLRTKSY